MDGQDLFTASPITIRQGASSNIPSELAPSQAQPDDYVQTQSTATFLQGLFPVLSFGLRRKRTLEMIVPLLGQRTCKQWQLLATPVCNAEIQVMERKCVIDYYTLMLHFCKYRVTVLHGGDPNDVRYGKCSRSSSGVTFNGSHSDRRLVEMYFLPIFCHYPVHVNPIFACVRQIIDLKLDHDRSLHF